MYQNLLYWGDVAWALRRLITLHLLAFVLGIHRWIPCTKNQWWQDLLCWCQLEQLALLWVRYTLQWRHNGHVGLSNHQPRHCLLNRLFRRRSKKTSKLRVNGLCVGNSPMTGEFPAQRTNNAENVSIWWRHHKYILTIWFWNVQHSILHVSAWLFLSLHGHFPSLLRLSLTINYRGLEVLVYGYYYTVPMPWYYMIKIISIYIYTPLMTYFIC